MKRRDFNPLLVCVVACLIFCSCIFLLGDFIQLIHEDGRAYWLSSDGARYLEHYHTFSGGEITPVMWIHFVSVGAPIILLFGTSGKVLPILLLACVVFFYALYSCMIYLDTKRWKFFLGILFIPYVFFGFFAINKEIYVVSSTLFFLTYYKTLNKKYLLFCIVALFFSRYYMLLVFIYCLIVFPPDLKRIRWRLIGLSLVVISLLAPIVLEGGVVSSYSSEGLLDGAGKTSSFSATVIRKYLYFLAYFPKYILLIFSRFWTAYTAGIFGETKGNLLGLLVAMYTVVLFTIAFYKVHYCRSFNYRFLMMVLFSPVPLMFNDVFHWRYYIFTLPMLIFYLAEKGNRSRLSSYYMKNLILKNGYTNGKLWAGRIPNRSIRLS